MRVAGQEDCLTGEMQDRDILDRREERWEARQVGRKTGRMQERRDAGQEGCRTGGI